MQLPTTMEEWKKIADEFEQNWNYPNCCGAVDGKHVLLQKPARSGSTFFNYKHTFSTVLMALVDANYRFIYVNVGAQGRMSDAGVFANSKLSRLLESNKLNLPPARQIANSDLICPYMIIGDDAFPLRLNLQKPYHRTGLVQSEIIFNYRLSRARRVVENAFGIMANRFRIFRAPIAMEPSKVNKIVMAATVLHNYLRTRTMLSCDPVERPDQENPRTGVVTPGDWRKTYTESGMAPLAVKGGRLPSGPKILRDQLANYFKTTGAIPWQWRLIKK